MDSVRKVIATFYSDDQPTPQQESELEAIRQVQP
jgi:hypothetical protein